MTHEMHIRVAWLDQLGETVAYCHLLVPDTGLPYAFDLPQLPPGAPPLASVSVAVLPPDSSVPAPYDPLACLGDDIHEPQVCALRDNIRRG